MNGKQPRFTYCYFVTQYDNAERTVAWVPFPQEAYRNSDVWRAHVVPPGTILGVMFQ